MELVLPGDAHRAIFYASLAPMLIIAADAPLYTMLDVNNAYLEATHTRRGDLIGKPVFGVFPGNPSDNVSKNIERTIFSFEQAIKNKVPHTMTNYRYDIPIPGTDDFEERYWTTSNIPVMNNDGEVIYFIHTPANVTQLVKLAEREENAVRAMEQQRRQLHATFMQAPVGIGIFKGPEFTVDLINPPLCKLYGKTDEELMGKPIFDVLTHVKGLGFEEIIANVMKTGKSYQGTGIPVPLDRHGRVENVYVNFVFEPFHEADGDIIGVIVVATEVTELVNTKNQFEEAEARARIAVDAVGMGTFDLDLTTGRMITSNRFAQIFGYDTPVERASYISVFHPEDVDIRSAAHQRAIKSGRLFYEARVIWNDDSIHWIRVEGKVFYDGGIATRILGTLLDITDQVNSKEEQRKLLTLVDNSVDLISILNLDGVNTYINTAGKTLLGFDSDEQVLNTPVSALHSPKDFIQVQQEVIPTVIEKGYWSGVMRVRHLQTGEIFPVQNNCFRIDDPVTGRPMAVGTVVRDLRPEFAAKQALSDSEQLLKTITTIAPTALWMFDVEGNITYTNQTWLDWTGKSLQHNLGTGWLDNVLQADRASVVATLQQALAMQQAFDIDFRMLHADGSMHWCNANARPYSGEGNTFSGYIGACVDITAQKQLQQQKDDFIAIASHELKTPVTSIKGYAQLLERILRNKGNLDEAILVGRMDLQLNRLTSLIGDLLDVTKINSGKLSFNNTIFDFNRFMQEVVQDLSRVSEQHEIIANWQGNGNVFGDKERLGQVINNLVTNAVKYSPHASKIIIHTEVSDAEVICCVQDFGIGIPADKLNKVFDQFYRVSGDIQHTFPGLGLGLYISSEIIKREQGRIWVHSTEGKGSAFYFALPLHIES